ncbi:MAG: hypothetical protein LC130_27925 [Bryobacterales bacterium]|nr:hypothetical protein [Bryobacterales bacterium]
MPSNNSYSFEDLHEGMMVEHEYTIDTTVYETFLSIFPDKSPVHVDDGYAKANGFDGIVMHGAILNGFLSHFVGMCFPGRRSLELSVDMRYLKPCYMGDKVVLRGTISQKLESRRVVVLDLAYENRTRSYTAARGRVQVVIMAEEQGDC